jgi:SnoaL-like domain
MHWLTEEEARAFCAKWLPAWTGNDPNRLLAFYTDDVFYSDPTIPDGVSGKAALRRYFEKLLGNNPNWVWAHEVGVPLQDGFLNKWRVTVPVGDRVVLCRGVCSVQFRDGLIYRNQVYFDATELMNALRGLIQQKRRAGDRGD